MMHVRRNQMHVPYVQLRTSPSAMQTDHSRWLQVAIAWTSFSILASMYLAPPVLAGLVAEDLGYSPDQVALLPAVNGFTQVALSMPAGVLLHRVRVSRCIATGLALYGCGTAGCALARSLAQLVALQIFFGIAACLAGPGPLVLLVSTWFDRQKATAVGVLLTAFGAAGVIWPPLLAILGERAGWRCSYASISAATWLIALPVTLLCMRDGPYSTQTQHAFWDTVQTCPSGTTIEVEASAKRGSPTIQEADLPPRAASSLAGWMPWWILSLRVWHLAALSFLGLFITQAFNNFLTLYLNRDCGVPLTTAGFYTSIIFSLNLAGKVLAGFLLDRPDGYRYGLCAMCLFALGCALVPRATSRDPLLTESSQLSSPNSSSEDGSASNQLNFSVSHSQLVVFALVYGLGYGGMFTIIQAIPLALFGSNEGFAKLQGFVLTCQRLGMIAGVAVTGRMRELTGSFDIAFILLFLLAMLAVLHFVYVHPPEKRRCFSSNAIAVHRKTSRTDWQEMPNQPEHPVVR